VPPHCKKMHWLQAILQSPVGRLDIFNVCCHSQNIYNNTQQSNKIEKFLSLCCGSLLCLSLLSFDTQHCRCVFCSLYSASLWATATGTFCCGLPLLSAVCRLLCRCALIVIGILSAVAPFLECSVPVSIWVFC